MPLAFTLPRRGLKTVVAAATIPSQSKIVPLLLSGSEQNDNVDDEDNDNNEDNDGQGPW